jgi:hypothetical protein
MPSQAVPALSVAFLVAVAGFVALSGAFLVAVFVALSVAFFVALTFAWLPVGHDLRP